MANSAGNRPEVSHTAENSLVRTLPDGPLDIIGDVHGEHLALQTLLLHLGYHHGGRHPEGRRLVFVGDLTDRGPDSPAVVRRVARLVHHGLAQCVLGNHELNLLLGKRKHGSAWFYGYVEALEQGGAVVPQEPAGDDERAAILEFFASLPLALERADLRVVHACWDHAAIAQARGATNILQLYHQARADIEAQLLAEETIDKQERELRLQNLNPVKVITSGPEEIAQTPFESGGKLRNADRRQWWNDYRDAQFCVFGHYWRVSVPGLHKPPNLFAAHAPAALLAGGRAMCLDYSVGGRWKELASVDFDGRHLTRLAALRWPEQQLVFDDGETCPAFLAVSE